MSLNTILATTPLTSTNYVLKATGTTIGNSLIFDNGTNVGIGNTNTTYKLDVSGTGNFTGALSGTSATFSGDLTIDTNTLYVDSTNNLVGIGGTPTGTYGKLSVFGGLSIKNDNNAKFEIGRYSSGAPNSYIKLGANSNSLRVTDNLDQFDIFTITNAGLVGIGTTSPSGLLQVGVANSGIYFDVSTQYTPKIKAAGTISDIQIESVGSGGNVYLTAPGATSLITLSTAGSERMRITSGGYFKASVDGTYLSTGAFHEIRSNALGNLMVLQQTASSGTLYGIDVSFNNQAPNNTTSTFTTFYDNVNIKAIFYSNGSIYNRTGTYGTISSDLRLKENIIEATSKLSDLMKLRVVNFNFLDDKDKKKNIGFVAQEFKEVFPSLTYITDTRKYDEEKNIISGFEDSLGLNVGMEFAILVKAIQEQQALITSLQEQINELKNK